MTQLRKFEHFSASQLKTFGLCQRKWWLEKIYGLESPQTEAQGVGVAYHEEAERYLKGGSHPLSPVFAGGVHHLPSRDDPDLLVEVPIGIDKRGKGAPTGRSLLQVDHIPAEGYMDVAVLKAGHPRVWDHKFVSGFRYVPDEDALRSDMQMLLYARAISVLHNKKHGGWPGSVTVGHVSYDKSSPGSSLSRSVTLNTDQVTWGWFGKIEPVVRAMKKVAEITTPDKVTPTWSACSAYRGCPHQKLCQNLRVLSLSPSEPNHPAPPTGVFTMAFAKPPVNATALPAVEAEQTPESIQAALRAHQAQRAQGVTPPDAPKSTPTTQVAQTAAAAQTPAAGGTAERKPRGYEEKFVTLGWTKEDAARSTTAAAKAIVGNGYTPAGYLLNAAGDVEVRPTQVAAPVAVKGTRNAKLWLDAVAAEEDKIGGMVSEANALGWSDAEAGWDVGTTNDNLDVPALTPDMLELVTNKKIGRTDPHLKLTIVDGAIVGVSNEPPPPPVVAAPAKIRATVPGVVTATEVALAKNPDAGVGLYLYIDCYLTKGVGEVRHLEDILKDIQVSVAQQKKKTHYLESGYRDGQSAVAALAMMQPGLFAGHVLVDSRSPCAPELLELLIPRATLVVRG